MFKQPRRIISDVTKNERGITPGAEPTQKKLTEQEKEKLGEIEKELKGIEGEKKRVKEEIKEFLSNTNKYTLKEMREKKEEFEKRIGNIKKRERRLNNEKNEILGIESWEELKFEVKRDYFEKEEREGARDNNIWSLSSLEDFVFAGRSGGYFSLYQHNENEGKMKLVEDIPERLLPRSILESKITKEYLAISGWDHHLKIFKRTSENPKEWFKEENEIDLSEYFTGLVSGLDLTDTLVGAGSWDDSKVLVYDLEHQKKALEKTFPEINNIYTFKFIPQTDFSLIAGEKGIEIINYKTGETKWKKLGIKIKKAIALSPNNKEVAFTKRGQSDKMYFLDISDIDNLKESQEPEEKDIFNKDGEKVSLPDNWRLSYTSDGKYLVVGSWTKNKLIIINRQTMQIEKEYGFGDEAIVDQKGNIISTDESGKQLVYID